MISAPAVARIRLNKAQREAVEHDYGPILVLAGAGSGKTGVVTQRIARLIRRGVPARAILAMTFTNKAAGEMRERVMRLVGPKTGKGLVCCTFHRFGLDVLQAETKALGLRGGRFAIFDRGDCTGVLRDALRNIASGRNYDMGAIISRISLAKNAFLDPDTYARKLAMSDDPYDEITTLAYPKYQAALRSMQAYDFDDLVCEPVRLMRSRQDVRQRWQQRFRFVIVDEYQDTNLSQLELLRMVASEHRNLMVVGDDDQAIYAWRGADVRNILDFEKHFKGAKVVRLERNYRSTKAVLDVANALLEHSEAKRHKKVLIPTRGQGDMVKVVTATDGPAEARFVGEEVARLVERGLARPRDIAILYRSNLQAPDFEAELRARGIPFQLIGGTQTFERKEVKDLLAYLSAALSAPELSVRRSINYPPRGIGEVALERLGSYATAYDLSLLSAAGKSHAIKGLSPTAREGCRSYVRIVQDVRRAIDDKKPAAEVVRNLAGAIELKRAILGESGTNNKAAARRWNNVEFMVRSFERRDAKKKMDRAGWLTFMRMLMLREEDAEDKAIPDKVTLTTIHGAKGLEFDYVFVMGIEEGFLPHSRSIEEHATDAARLDGGMSDEIEQERRLFYVAITRAKLHLYLCRAQVRPARGKMAKRAPSRFLLQLPEELLEPVDVMAVPPADPKIVHRGAEDVLAALLGNK